MTKPRAKAGTSKAAAARRRRLFVDAYIANGHNGTQAAIAAGYSPRGADVAAVRLLGDDRISGEIAAAARSVGEAVRLDAERVLQEHLWLAHSDMGDFLDDNDAPLPIKRLPRHVRAAIQSIDLDGETGKVTKIRLWDKGAALDRLNKHLGLYERDNSQRQPNLSLQVLLVGDEPTAPSAKAKPIAVEVERVG